MKNYGKKLCVILCAMLLWQSGIFEGRIPFFNSIVNAATNSVKVQMYNTTKTATTNSITPRFRIVNTGTNSVNLADIKIRYYYTIDGDKAQIFYCDYSSIGSANVTGTFVKIPESQSSADYYLEIGFMTGSLAPNASIDAETRSNKYDWSNYTQTGDYSFNVTDMAFVDWNKVTAYYQGTLVWGSAPEGSATSTPTNTSTPTYTSTPANTPTPTIPGTDATLLTSADAYIKFNSTANQWTIGTGKVEKKIRLNSQGQYLLTSFVNKDKNKEYIQGGQISDEFSITVADTEYTGSNSSWTFVGNDFETLKQGEIQLTVTLQNSVVTVARNYIIYPSTGIIQEWNVFTNRGNSTVNFKNPSIIRQRIMSNDLSNTDFHYMTGGANFSGSNTLKTVQLTSSYTRRFDSYDTAEFTTVNNYTANGVMDNKQGASIWNEFYALRDRASSQGIFMTFDYLGHWYSDVGNVNGNIYLSPSIVTSNDLAAGSGIATGRGLTGVFSGDVDDMGNTILDYVYRYKWDYTNDKYMGTVSGGQNYMNSTVPPPDQMPNAFAVVRYLRYVGADNFGIDDSWQNRNGDWKNSWAGDFPGLTDYLNKSDMTLTVWYPPWQADEDSKVLNEHPEYQVSGDQPSSFYGCHLNNSKNDVIDWELKLLSGKQAEWGSHIWRYDAHPIWAANGSRDDKTEDNTMIDQSKNFYDLLQRFKDQNKNAGISGCSSGGELITIESARFSDIQQSTDGNVAHMENYWNSLITPPDKLNTYYGLSNALIGYNKKNRGAMNCSWSFDAMSGLIRYNDETISVEAETLENLRKDAELYHFLKAQGVVGRWVKVYRPAISGGYDPTFYMQKMNGSNTKGYIVTRDIPGIYGGGQISPIPTTVPNDAFGQNVTIYPKGLISNQNYTISTLEGGMAETTHTGSYWMSNGIPLTPLNYGEIIFFNIDNRPGTGKDTTAPGAPSNAIKVSEKNVGHNGIGITWTAGTDNNWLSYYEIFKNGTSIDKVSKGTYYFDMDGSIGDNYEVRTVDGDENVSSLVAAQTNPEQYIASTDFSQTQGQRNWYYQQRDSSGNYSDMSVDGDHWKGDQEYCLNGSNYQHPDTNDSVRKWIAPRTGAIRVAGTAKMFQTGGDGVVVSILQNNQVIWGPKNITGTDLTGISHDFSIGICEGDEIKFIVNKNENTYFDSTLWDPTIIYVKSNRASAEFSSTQGTGNWYYQQLDSLGNYTDMTWDAAGFGWRGNQTYCITGVNAQHPDTNDSVRKWVAPKDGTISVSGLAKLADTGGDGVYLSIKKNNSNVLGPTLLNSNSSGIRHNFNILVQQGDSICFVVNKNGNNNFDSTVWDPSVFYLAEAETNSLLDYSPDQGRKNWYYQEKDNSGDYYNLVFDKSINVWMGDEQSIYLGMEEMNPGYAYDIVRKWVAPYPGKIHITGNYVKSSNGGDGVILKILKNSTSINTFTLSDTVNQVSEDDFVNVNAGDEIIFELNRNGDTAYDSTEIDINIQYE